MTESRIVVEVTLKEIAANQGIHYVYVHRLSREKGFPNPVRVIGRNLMFDSDAVARFFANRRRRAPRTRQ
jgi:predicted DNA-binding transcriptional regulator AlpA